MTLASKQERKRYLDQLSPKGMTRFFGTGDPEARMTCGVVSMNTNPIVDLCNLHYDIIWVIEGCGRYIDQQGREHPYQAGSVFQRIPGVLHSNFWDSEFLECYISMPPASFRVLSQLGVVSIQRPVLHSGVHVEQFRLMRDIFQGLHYNSQVNPGRILGMMHEFVILSAQSDAGTEATPELDELENARLLLEDRRHDHLPLEEMASRSGLGYESFRKRFRTRYRISPHAYRIRCRIEEAASCLREPGARVSEVAESFGYVDVFTFSKQFRNVTGMSPSQYIREG